MGYDRDLVRKKFIDWGKYLSDYQLPRWEDIPDIGLYMDQVLTLLKQYLDFLPPELKDDQFITAATINNYVNKKYMPKPNNKRYYRIHIAYMIMICTLKHCLSISLLQKIIPMGIEEDEVKSIYTAYATRHKIAIDYFTEQFKVVAGPILYNTDPEHQVSVHGEEDLITVSAVISVLSGLIAEKMLMFSDTKYNNDKTEVTENE